jgi:hypothetical protein
MAIYYPSLDVRNKLDGAIAAYCNYHYFLGEHVTMGEYSVAAFVHGHSPFSRHGELKLPRTRETLKGWRVMTPPRARTPEAMGV